MYLNENTPESLQLAVATSHAWASSFLIIFTLFSVKLLLIKMQSSHFIKMQHMAEMPPYPASFRPRVYLTCAVGICLNPH